MGRRAVSPETQKSRQRARDREKKKKKREEQFENPLLRQLEQERNTEARRRARQDPVRRRIEQARNTAARRLARQDPIRRLKERERDTAARRIARQDPVRRRKERERNTIARWLSRQLSRDAQLSCDFVEGKLHWKRAGGTLQNFLQKIASGTSHSAESSVKEKCVICSKEIRNGSQMFSSLTENQFPLFPEDCAQRYQVKFKGKENVLCSDQCVDVFCCVNNIRTSNCDTCRTFFEETPKTLTLDFQGSTRRFCSKNCFNFFVLSNRKVVQCHWCKGTKYNLNMLECVGPNNSIQLFCSVNCLSVSRASLPSTGLPPSVPCDNCRKATHVQFHVAMSDASVRNMCSYECTMQFQNRFGGTPTSFGMAVKPASSPAQGPIVTLPPKVEASSAMPFDRKEDRTSSIPLPTMPAFPQHSESAIVPKHEQLAN